MATKPRRRTRVVHIALTEAEYRELKAIQAALGQPYRFFLVAGVRHARQVFEREERHQAAEA